MTRQRSPKIRVLTAVAFVLAALTFLIAFAATGPANECRATVGEGFGSVHRGADQCARARPTSPAAARDWRCSTHVTGSNAGDDA